MCQVVFHGLIGEPNNPLVAINEDIIENKPQIVTLSAAVTHRKNSNISQNQNHSTPSGKTSEFVCPHLYFC